MATTKAPIIQQHELTWKCNNNCQFCYNPERCWTAFTPRQEDRKRNITIAELSVNHGVMAACPTGGEPLLVGKHLFEILNIYKQGGCYTSLNSNGRLITSQVAEKLAQARLNSALISIHGVAALHDEMVQARNAFIETWRGMLNLKKNGIAVTPNFVATSKNIHGLNILGEKLIKAGFGSMTVTPFLPSWGSASHIKFLLQKEHYRAYFEQVKQTRAIGLKIDSTLPIPPCVLIKFFPDNWPDYLDVHSPRVCMAGRSFGVVSPDGYFRACIQAPFFPDYGGNLLENYESSWQNANHWADKKMLPNACLQCQALSICGGGCRTSCLWENNGKPHGTTMYMGESLTKAEAEPFIARTAIHQRRLSKTNSAYQWQPDIKIRHENWGVIVFNPRIQSFTVLSPEARCYLSEIHTPLEFASEKTRQVLRAIGAIKLSASVPKTTKQISAKVTILPATYLLPRLADNLQADNYVCCLRADTGERYFF